MVCDFLVGEIRQMMRITLAALASLLEVNVHAHHLDLMGDAHRAIIESLPGYTFGSDEVIVSDLRMRDIVETPALFIAAVCGRLDYSNAEEGRTDFIVWYANDDDGKVIVVGLPYLYGPLSHQTNDPRYAPSVRTCGDAALRLR